MKAIVREHFNAELQRAKIAIAEQDFETAWKAFATGSYSRTN